VSDGSTLLLSKDQPLIETISATVDLSHPRAPAGPPSQGGVDDPGDQPAHKTASPTAKSEGKGVRRAAGLGIQAGSFLGLMLSARNRSSGNGLTDVQVRGHGAAPWHLEGELQLLKENLVG